MRQRQVRNRDWSPLSGQGADPGSGVEMNKKSSLSPLTKTGHVAYVAAG